MKHKTDLRIQKTCAALTQALGQLLLSAAYDKITVQQLCETAGVRRATFYKHFSDMETFSGYVASEVHESAVKSIPKKASISDALYQYTSSLFSFAERYRDILRKLTESKRYAELESRIQEPFLIGVRDLLAQAASQTSLPVTPEIFAVFYVNGIMKLIWNWVESDTSVSKETLLPQIRALLLALTEMHE